MLQKVGNVFAAISVKGQGVLKGARHLVGTVKPAQSDDFLDVVRSVEAFFA